MARVVCHGIFELSTFISKHRSAGSTQQKVLVALEIFKEVARIARCFNRLIRISLKEALKLEQEHHIPGALPLPEQAKLHALTNVDSSGHKPAAAASVSVTGVAAKDTLYGYWSLTPENTGVSPLSKMQKKYKLPSDLCVKCKLTIEDTCVHLGMYQRWHPHCLQCQSCNKAASVGSGSTQTSSHAQVNAINFLYEPMSIENVPLLGLVPSVVYCMDYVWPTVTISDLAVFNFFFSFTIRRGFQGVTYMADTCLLTIRPGGSHMTPPVSC